MIRVMEKNASERGQMLLVVVLTMIVALTVGLSVVSRTITNLRLSRQSEESQRAFQAAEAGIQQVLESGIETGDSSGDFLNNAVFESETFPIGGASQGEFLLNAGELVDQSIGMDVWLSEHPDFSSPVQGAFGGTNINVYWSTENQLCGAPESQDIVPVMEIVMLLTTPAASYSVDNPILRKFVFEPCTGGAQRVSAPAANNAPEEIGNVVLQYSAQVTIPAGERALIMKVIPYFNSTRVGISSAVDLPLQGKVIESTGVSGETTRKVRYFTSYPQVPPEIFPYSLLTQ